MVAMVFKQANVLFVFPLHSPMRVCVESRDWCVFL